MAVVAACGSIDTHTFGATSSFCECWCGELRSEESGVNTEGVGGPAAKICDAAGRQRDDVKGGPVRADQLVVSHR